MRSRQRRNPKVPKSEITSRVKYRTIGAVHFSACDSAAYVRDAADLLPAAPAEEVFPKPSTSAAKNGRTMASVSHHTASALILGISRAYSGTPVSAPTEAIAANKRAIE